MSKEGHVGREMCAERRKCCVGHCMHAGALHTCCTPRGVRRASRFLGSLYSRPTLCVPVHVAIRCITPTITGHTHARTHARLHACADTFGVPNNVHHAYVSAVAPQLLQRREREHVKGPQVAALPGILHGCRCHPQAWCLAAADARLSSSRGRHCRRGDHAHAAGGTVRLRTSHALVADGAQHNPRHRIRRDARSDAQGAAHAIEANVAAVASGLPLMHQCQRLLQLTFLVKRLNVLPRPPLHGVVLDQGYSGALPMVAGPRHTPATR